MKIYYQLVEEMKLMEISKWCVIIVFSAIIIGCQENAKNQPKKHEIGEYLYIDQYKCAHISQDCYRLRFVGEESKPNYMVKRVLKSKIKRSGTTCSWCIDDEIYKEIQSIIKNNKSEDSLIIGW